MSKTTKVIILLVSLTFYFVILNLITLINFPQINSSLDPVVSSTGTDTQAAFGDRVEVTTYRNKLLWNISSTHYPDYKDSTIHLFGFIPLPLVIHNFNFFLIHLLMFTVSAFMFLLILFSNERRYYE